MTRPPLMNRPSRRRTRSTRFPVGLELLEGRIAPAGLISLGDASIAEGDNGQTTLLNFQVARSGDLGPQVTVSYHTEDGSAHSGVDFAAQSGTVVIAAGSASATISVPITGNQILQPNRNFRVVIDSVIDVSVPFTLADQQTFTTGSNPVSVSSADLNGDGKPDIAVANYGSSFLSVLLNTTAPGSSTATFATTSVPFAGQARSVDIADINGDGKPDIAVATSYNISGVAVLLNTTTPGATTASFTAPVNFVIDPVVGGYPWAVTIGDLNGDGRPDIAAVEAFTHDPAGPSVAVLLNTTAPGANTPSFSPVVSFPTGQSPRSVAIGDVNGDGKPDLVVGNYGTRFSSTPGSISVLLNTTAPGSTTPSFSSQAVYETGANPYAVAIGDLNGDGKPEIAVANYRSDFLSLLLNQTTPGAAAPNFAAQQKLTVGRTRSLAIGDVDADGKPDLVTANWLNNNGMVLRNTTTPGAATFSFTPPVFFRTGVGANSGILADFNGDGMPDVAVANAFSNSVSVVLNTTAAGLTPTFSVQQSLTTGALPAAVATGDLNGDGKPDLVVANTSSNTLSVFLNTTAPGSASATFVRTTVATPRAPKSVAIIDLNGDGKPDVVATSYATNPSSPVAGADGVIVLLNTTTPGATTASFTAPTAFTTSPAIVNPRFVAAGDLNGDGKPDLAVVGRASSKVAVLLNTTPTGASSPSFAPLGSFAVGTSNRSVAIGDLNGDGKPDLVVPNYNDNTVSVLLNTAAPGAATPSFAGKTDFAVGVNPYSVAIGDLNGDGKPDLAVANYRSDFLSFMLNTTAPGAPAPGFAPQQKLTVGRNGPLSIVIADFDLDGKPDIATANYFKANALVLGNITTPGASTFSFGSPVFPAAGSRPYSVASADLNGDGKPDLAVTNASSGNVSLILNVTAPSAAIATTVDPVFTGPQSFGTGGSFAAFVIVGDLNADGRPDVVVANAQSQSVSVLLNTTPPGSSSSSFAPAQSFTVGNIPVFVAIGDLNGDGKPDIAVANLGGYPSYAGSVSVLLNTTTPGASAASFAPQVEIPTGNLSYSVAIGDLNGDGKPDLAVGNYGSYDNQDAGGVFLLLNTTPVAAPVPSFSDPVFYPTGFTSKSVSVADINGDGKPDVAITNLNDGTISIFSNTTPVGASSPSFAGPTVIPIGPNPSSIAIGDLNGDGKPDIADVNGYSNNVSVLFNTTTPGSLTPTFTAPKAFGVASDQGSISIGDLNGDGKPDLAVSSYQAQAVTVLVNQTSAGSSTPDFKVESPTSVGSSPFSTTLGDINQDGRLDLVVGNDFIDKVSVLLNTTVANASNNPATATGTIVDDDAPVTITLAAGDGQTTLIGTAFPTTLAVVVRNARGNPVQGAVVTFSTPTSGPSALFGGSQQTTPVLTDANGRATAPSLIANSVVGSYLATAQVAGLATTVGFHLNNVTTVAAAQTSVGWGSRTQTIAGRTNLPWTNISRIVLTFNSAVTPTPADLTVTGLKGRVYGVTGVRVSGNTVTWTLSGVIELDVVTITVNPALANYTAQFRVLPGDINDDGLVNGQDLTVMSNAYQGLGFGGISPSYFDLNGDGLVNLVDYNIVRKSQGRRLP